MTKSPYKTNRNMLVPYYLMYSYLYYKENESLVDDTEYDQICKDILTEWNSIEHFHKHLVSKDALTAGTGYDIVYPQRVINAAKALLNG